MDNQGWGEDFTYNGKIATYVSCHAGDFGQIASCNMMGDQPLFYIDDSADQEIESDDFMLSGDIGAYDERMLSDMRDKLSKYDRAAKLLSDINIILPEDQFDISMNVSQKKLSLEEIITFASSSGTFNEYHQFINDKKIEIILTDTVETSFYNRTNSQILLNKNLNLFGATIALVKSMRMAWNHKQGVLINPLSFHPEEAVLINRILEADNNVVVIAMMWDMKLSGQNNMWDTAMSGSDYDLCVAYAMEAMTDFRSIKSGLASRATFEKWFISGRCKSFDRQIIQTMLGKHVDIIIGNQDASRTIAMDLISGVGSRPNGKNYLAPIVVQIMNDGLFCDIRDRANANFLWFVTFERRMEEMEQELQHGESDNTNKGLKNNVTSLLPNTDTNTDTIKSDHVASVFFLDHFRAG